MRGNNIRNIYVIEGKEYFISGLSMTQLEYINSNTDREKYNILRNIILKNEGHDVECTIKIAFPEQKIRVFKKNGIELIY
jgi:hypothetical protein